MSDKLQPEQPGQPDRRETNRREEDGTLRQRLEEIEDDYRSLAAANRDAIFDHWVKTRYILGLITTFLLVLGVISIILLAQSSSQAAKIQASRLGVIRSECVDQNTHHVSTVKQLQHLTNSSISPDKELVLGISALIRISENSPAARLDPKDTKAEVSHLLAYVRLYGAQQKGSLTAIIKFIDALAPYRDCNEVVDAARLSG